MAGWRLDPYEESVDVQCLGGCGRHRTIVPELEETDWMCRICVAAGQEW